MNAQRSVCSSAVRAQASVLVVAVTAAGAMLTPCLRDAFGTSSFQVLSEVKPLNSAAAEEVSASVFEPTISTHDSHVSHDFSGT